MVCVGRGRVVGQEKTVPSCNRQEGKNHAVYISEKNGQGGAEEEEVCAGRRVGLGMCVLGRAQSPAAVGNPVQAGSSSSKMVKKEGKGERQSG